MPLFQNLKRYLPKLTLVTKSFLALNLVSYVVFNLLGLDAQNLLGYSIFNENFNWEQPISCLFLHANFSHLFSNMIMLYFIGTLLERLIGPIKFFWIYLVSGIIAYFAQGMINTEIPMVGASGCVYGILLATATVAPKFKVHLFFLIPVNILYITLVLFALEVIALFGPEDHIAHVAHIVGGIIGSLMSFYYLRCGLKVKYK